MKRLAVLGSTGSIGVNTLKVAHHLKEEVVIEALGAKQNIDLLERQAKEFCPRLIGVYDTNKARELQKRLPHVEIIPGMEGLKAVASCAEANFVIAAMSGLMGLQPTLAAINAGKNIGLANKETLVSAGHIVTEAAKAKGCALIPIDSEHSAIFQCLKGESSKAVARLILTASGGPFFQYSTQALAEVTLEKALLHPTWKMGPKVTIDSSTLMNKGLEVIEAYWLFHLPAKKIEVIIHPQSIIHSMVEFTDGSMLAQMSEPSMIVPIQYAITHPERRPSMHPAYDFQKLATLQFFPPDLQKFKCLQLAYHALETGGSMPCYMNGVNEVLVERFLNKEISWINISLGLEELMSRHDARVVNSLEDVLAVDQQARQAARSFMPRGIPAPIKS